VSGSGNGNGRVAEVLDRVLAGELDEARRVLRAAFARRHDLAELATKDPDLVSLADEIATLAAG